MNLCKIFKFKETEFEKTMYYLMNRMKNDIDNVKCYFGGAGYKSLSYKYKYWGIEFVFCSDDTKKSINLYYDNGIDKVNKTIDSNKNNEKFFSNFIDEIIFKKNDKERKKIKDKEKINDIKFSKYLKNFIDTEGIK